MCTDDAVNPVSMYSKCAAENNLSGTSKSKVWTSAFNGGAMVNFVMKLGKILLMES